MSEDRKVVIDDQEYLIDDLPEEAQYCVRQIDSLRSQVIDLNARLDQLFMAENGFSEALKRALEPKADDVAEGELADKVIA